MTLRSQLGKHFGIPVTPDMSPRIQVTVRIEEHGTVILGWCPVSGKRQYARPEDVPTRYKNHGLEPYECSDRSMFHGTTEVVFYELEER